MAAAIFIASSFEMWRAGASINHKMFGWASGCGDGLGDECHVFSQNPTPPEARKGWSARPKVLLDSVWKTKMVISRGKEEDDERQDSYVPDGATSKSR